MNLPVPIGTTLLAPADATALGAIDASLTHTYAVRQIRRTETEMRISVLDAIHFPTPASRYWQAIREQCVELEQAAVLDFEKRRNDIKLIRARMALAHALDHGDDLTASEHQIDVDQCLWNDAAMRQVAADRVREILLWEKIKDEQIAADPTFDRDDADTHQLVSYTKQFILRASIADQSKMTGGELDNLIGQLRAGVARAVEKGVIKTVLAGLPKNAADLTEKQIKHFATPPKPTALPSRAYEAHMKR